MGGVGIDAQRERFDAEFGSPFDRSSRSLYIHPALVLAQILELRLIACVGKGGDRGTCKNAQKSFLVDRPSSLGSTVPNPDESSTDVEGSFASFRYIQDEYASFRTVHLY